MDDGDQGTAGAVPVTVLLVEDNETDAFVIREVLKQSGMDFRLHVSTDGEQALSMMGIIGTQGEPGNEGEPISPGLILLDLNIPKVSGLEVLAQMRNTSRYRNTPVVIVTSSESQKDRRAVQELRGNAYFAKPNDLAAFMKLSEVIRSVLSAASR